METDKFYKMKKIAIIPQAFGIILMCFRSGANVVSLRKHLIIKNVSYCNLFIFF